MIFSDRIERIIQLLTVSNSKIVLLRDPLGTTDTYLIA